MITETIIFRKGEATPAFSLIKTEHKMPLAFSDSEDFPKWAKLSNNKCPNCPLNQTNSWCPAAVSLASCVNAASSWDSTESVTLVIVAGNRRITEITTAAEALSSVLINQIIHSTCPLMQFDFWFWPFFSASLTVENVLFRRLAIDLICRDFSEKRGIEFESSRISTEELDDILTHLMKRIHQPGIISGDAVPNAFTKLSTLETYSSLFQDEIYNHIEQGLKEHETSKGQAI